MIMAKWERLNDAGEVVEVVDWVPRADERYIARERSCDCAKDAKKHEFIDCDHWTEREVHTRGDRPQDIPHKGVKWRKHVQAKRGKPDPAEAREQIMAAYRNRIVDALPDMDAVFKIVQEREAHLAGFDAKS